MGNAVELAAINRKKDVLASEGIKELCAELVGQLPNVQALCKDPNIRNSGFGQRRPE